MAKIPCEYSGGGLVKSINKTFSNVTFNANGEIPISAPTTPSGYTFLTANPFNYSGLTKGAISCMGGSGNYLQGTPNITVTSITVRYIYIKTDDIETTTA